MYTFKCKQCNEMFMVRENPRVLNLRACPFCTSGDIYTDGNIAKYINPSNQKALLARGRVKSVPEDTPADETTINKKKFFKKVGK